MPIKCEIVSQSKVVYSGDIDMVVLPGVDGQMGILPHHAPVLALLDYGIITVRTKDGDEHFTVAGGIAEVQPDQVTILADAAENVEEIDIDRALQARKRSEESLKQTLPVDTDRYLTVQAALKRSNLRLESAKRYRKDSRSKLSE